MEFQALVPKTAGTANRSTVMASHTATQITAVLVDFVRASFTQRLIVRTHMSTC